MTEIRPELTKNLSPENFRAFYWLKEELVAFCREHQISTAGSKIELTDRIIYFLKNGVAPANGTTILNSNDFQISMDKHFQVNYQLKSPLSPQ
ncbi:MAG: SAP domain-containing protein, partial [Phototrophicales bacterium]|nr:SAP domain-containing protein [Phototrophicales bacterium]